MKEVLLMMSQGLIPMQSEQGSKEQGVRLRAQGLFAGFCAILPNAVIAAPSVLADREIYGYVGPNGTLYSTNAPGDQRFAEVKFKRRYH